MDTYFYVSVNGCVLMFGRNYFQERMMAREESCVIACFCRPHSLVLDNGSGG